MSHIVRLGLAFAIVGALGGTVAAQDYPTKPVRIIVPSAPGGSADFGARSISNVLSDALKQPFVVENRPGAGTVQGSDYVAKSPADGYTLLLASSAHTTNETLVPDVPFKLMKDFVPVIKGVAAPLVLVTHPSVPAKTLTELVAYVKKNPGKLGYASFNPGTPSHFLGFQMNERFGLDLAHIPYKGSGQQTNDLVAGHALLGFSQLGSTLPHIAAGRLNAIAVTSHERSRFLPDVPTLAELGHPEFTTTIWFGMFLRAGTPAPVVDAYVKAARAAHTDPEVRKRLETLGFDVPAQTGPQVAADIATQTARWARLIKATGFKAD